MRFFDQLYRMVDGVTQWSAATFNSIWRSIDERLHKLEERDLTVDGIIGSIVADTQKAVQEVFDPAILTIRKIQEAGFLIARSSTVQTLVEGRAFTFVVDAGDSRDLFTPSVFTIASRASTSDDYAVLRTLQYDRTSGSYAFEVVSITGDPGPHSDWIIGALAGPTLAQLEFLRQAGLVRDTTVEAATNIGQLTKAATQAAATATEERKTVSGLRLATSNDAKRAVEAADRAQTFDPTAYYIKGETRTRQQITDEVNARAIALRQELTGLAPEMLDTFAEVAARIEAGEDSATALAAVVASKASSDDLAAAAATLNAAIATKADADATEARLAALEDDVAGAYTYSLAFGG